MVRRARRRSPTAVLDDVFLDFAGLGGKVALGKGRWPRRALTSSKNDSRPTGPASTCNLRGRPRLFSFCCTSVKERCRATSLDFFVFAFACGSGDCDRLGVSPVCNESKNARLLGDITRASEARGELGPSLGGAPRAMGDAGTMVVTLLRTAPSCKKSRPGPKLCACNSARFAFLARSELAAVARLGTDLPCTILTMGRFGTASGSSNSASSSMSE